jgi:hypothetical protein
MFRYMSLMKIRTNILRNSTAMMLLGGILLIGTGNSQQRSALHQWGGPRSTSEPAESSSNDQTFQIDREYEERQFVHRIDNLMTALASFSSSYKTGHVIDVKKVKEVRKALREIEKSEWFKFQKTE